MAKPKLTLIWDLATRLFHWSLVILVSTCLYTGLSGGLDEMDLHMISGYGVLALLIFRLMWGFVGSTHARFLSFIVSPHRAWRYLRSLENSSRHEQPDANYPPGHNPLGGYAIVVMIALLLSQAVTGLFASDDIFIEGPLMHLVSYDQSRTLTGIHHLVSKLLMGLIGLHLLAVMVHEILLKDRIVWPMITGRKQLPEKLATVTDTQHKPLLAIVLFTTASLSVYVIVDVLWW
ncbi:MAG: cytochrome b/b6 domain-containing protein [Pseudomonadota bacterium]